MSLKSRTCRDRNGKPLSVYHSQYDAEDAASMIPNPLVPYQCNACGLWHLSPADRVTPSNLSCGCTGRDKQPKKLYESKASAERRASILYREKGAFLDIYQCPKGQGWHLKKG